MGVVIGTCGHEVTGETDTIAIKDFNKEGKRVVSYPVVCDECLKFYKKKKMILSTEKEQKKWFDGKIKY